MIGFVNGTGDSWCGEGEGSDLFSGGECRTTLSKSGLIDGGATRVCIGTRA